MYDETHYFDTHDPNSIPGGSIGSSKTVTNCSGFPQLMGGSNSSNNSIEENLKLSNLSIEEDLSSHHNPSAAAMDFDLEHEFNTHLMQEVLHDPNSAAAFDQPNWDTGVQEMQDMGSQQAQQYYHHHLQNHDAEQQIELQNNLQCFNSTPFTNPPYTVTPTPDLLNLLHLPRCSPMLPNSSISFTNPNKRSANFHNSLDIFGEFPMGDSDAVAASTVLYDAPLHLNLPPQPPIFRELFHSLPHSYGLPGSRGSGSLFGGMDEREGTAGIYQDGDGRQFENSVLDFRREMSDLGRGGDDRGTKHFTTEKQRREQLNDKFKALRTLVPNPTKTDRASIVGDATDYIKELLRTVDELKILVDKKRCGRVRSKKLKTEEEAAGDMESSSMKPLSTLTDREQSFNGSLRSSWLQRKSKETEVDVRIIDDEVTIKLIQRKKMNCLLSVSKILDELQLEILHVSGGNIGEHYSFLFNTKIYEGSSVYASAIAKKLIEAVDKHYVAFPPVSY